MLSGIDHHYEYRLFEVDDFGDGRPIARQQGSGIVTRGHTRQAGEEVAQVGEWILRFIRLRGGCPSTLTQAVPTVADIGKHVRAGVLDESQRRPLLAAFERKSSQGLRTTPLRCARWDSI